MSTPAPGVRCVRARRWFSSCGLRTLATSGCRCDSVRGRTHPVRAAGCATRGMVHASLGGVGCPQGCRLWSDRAATCRGRRAPDPFEHGEHHRRNSSRLYRRAGRSVGRHDARGYPRLRSGPLLGRGRSAPSGDRRHSAPLRCLRASRGLAHCLVTVGARSC